MCRLLDIIVLKHISEAQGTTIKYPAYGIQLMQSLEGRVTHRLQTLYEL
jgi:hypothetical protein